MNKHASRPNWIKLAARAGLAALALGTSGAVYSLFEARRLEARHVRLILPRLAPAFDGYRIAQFSDLHADTADDLAHVADVVALVNKQQPDAVVITGDFVSHEVYGSGDEMVAVLSQLRPRDATIAVLGNHDYWDDPARVRQVIARSGIVNVSNDVYTLRRGDSCLHIAGVDTLTEKRARLDITLSKLPPDGAAILLAHEPDFADVSAATGRFDLQMSGHTHGGQIRLPIPVLGNFMLPAHSRRYPLGLYLVGNMYQYTNRGIGAVWPYMRFNSRPEITVFTLHSGQTHAL